jgi:predicted ATPase
VAAEFLYQQGLPPQATYRFKHALIQDAAYQSLLRSTRQQYHQRIARILEERFPEMAETQPELLAHHYTEAGLSAQAVPYWQRAGQRANQQSAHTEAVAHLTRGLELLHMLPDSPERLQYELALQLALGAALMVTKGYGAPEVERVYAQARQLCQQVGDTPQLFPALHGLWQFYILRAELQTAHELAEQLCGLAHRLQEPALLPKAYRTLGEPLVWLGVFAPARVELEQGMAHGDSQQTCSHALLPELHPGVTCRIFTAFALWMLGYPDQAQHRIHEALALAQALASPINLAMAQCFTALLHQFRREGGAARKCAEVTITLSTERGFPHFLALGHIYGGWALVTQGQGEAGVRQIHQGLTAYEATGATLERPYSLALLAEAYRNIGQAAAGLPVLAEARRLVDTRGDRWCEAELHRLQGEFLLQQPVEAGLKPAPTEAAEACFHQALDVARQQQAKSWELRAAMSLSRLWQQQGQRDEARALLAPIYGWFTEGFDTADLQETKALLEELEG